MANLFMLSKYTGGMFKFTSTYPPDHKKDVFGHAF